MRQRHLLEAPRAVVVGHWAVSASSLGMQTGLRGRKFPIEREINLE